MAGPSRNSTNASTTDRDAITPKAAPSLPSSSSPVLGRFLPAWPSRNGMIFSLAARPLSWAPPCLPHGALADPSNNGTMTSDEQATPLGALVLRSRGALAEPSNKGTMTSDALAPPLGASLLGSLPRWAFAAEPSYNGTM